MQPTAELLILGTFHMANPGRDAIRFEVDDVLAPHRQAEIEALVSQLSRFDPTKVCIEHPHGSQSDLDAAYLAYRDGRGTDHRSEHVQIAFRLAARCGSDRVYGIDDQTPMRWDRLEEYLADHPVDADRFEREMREEQSRADEASERLRRQTIGDYLRDMNEESALRDEAAFYVDVLALGGPGEHRAADMTASWYERNIRIFSNLAGLTEPGDRIFVLFGGGHVPILRHLAVTSTRHHLVDVSEYLGP